MRFFRRLDQGKPARAGRLRRTFLASLIATTAGALLFGGAPHSRAAARSGGKAAPPVPRLVVLIVVDQFRADYPERFSQYFGERGFRRLVREGRVFKGARYSHVTTLTGPGHSVIGSGIYADRTGIVGNRWYSYEAGDDANCALAPAREGVPGECASPGKGGVPAPGTKMMKGPCAFDGTTLAERVKGRYPEARVVGVAVKDRAAILMAGKKADAAYWVEEKEGGTAELACSGYYSSCRPEVLAFGKDEGLQEKGETPDSMTLFRRHPAWKEWDCSLPTPCGKACPDDRAEAHAEEEGLGKEFPHPVKSVAALLTTPYGNDLLEAFAEKVIEAHDLGRNRRGVPDVLAVGFSSTDYFGHPFGPDSCEAADGMKRLDATLGRLLDFLESRVGREGLLVFVTGDHGVAPLPEVSLGRGIPAGRLDFYGSAKRASGKIGDLPPVRQRLEYSLSGRLGLPEGATTPLSEALVLAFHEPCLYLNRGRIGAKDLPVARAWLKEYLLHQEGIQEVYTAEEIEAGEAPGPVRTAFRADRSGDLMILLRPYWTFSGPGGGADHGQAYDYDARVPLMAWGGVVAPGVEEGTVDPAQIAPTLAALLGLETGGFSRPSPLPLRAEK